MEKEKLIDYLFDQADGLQAHLAGVQEELRLQREQSAERHKNLTLQVEKMEKRAVAAEKRADTAEKRAIELDKQIAELTAALTAMLDGSVIKDFKSQIIKAEKERDDARHAN